MAINIKEIENKENLDLNQLKLNDSEINEFESYVTQQVHELNSINNSLSENESQNPINEKNEVKKDETQKNSKLKYEWYVQSSYLKKLRKKSEYQDIIKILDNILNENQTNNSLSKDIDFLKHLMNSKEIQSIEATFILGLCFDKGIGVTLDKKQAFAFYQLAANQGHPFAQKNLGECYDTGNGVDKDEKRAFELYKLAANLGHAGAQTNVGYCYRNGIGVPKDEKQAFEYYQLAAKQENIFAQFNLGFCFEKGIGVAKDEKQAFEIIQSVAKKGEAFFQCYLGYLYENGIGITKDENKAFEYYQLAAKQGNVQAQDSLGVCYAMEIGVTKDEKRAVDLYQLAANLDYAKAQINLAVCYLNGIGVAKDIKRAVLLLRAAAIQDDSEAITLLNETLEKCIYYFPNLDEAFSFYQKFYFKNKKISDLTTLAFCYQMGLGIDKNIKEAIDLYQQAIQKGAKCYQDLFNCYKVQYEIDLKLNVLLDFYETLKLEASEKIPNAIAASLLAYLYEYGAPGLEKNLSTALQYYEKAQTMEAEYSNNKIQYYTPFLDLKTNCQEVYNSGLASVIAEYAFENEKLKEQNGP